jgi:hypothetical protein
MPTSYVGKLASNYYCRGWNAKRRKYCTSRAGLGTQHAGVGRCKMHGGTKERSVAPAPALRDFLPPAIRSAVSRTLRTLLAGRLPDPAEADAVRDEILELRVRDHTTSPATSPASS